MSWGHATSTDLLHWTEHPVAIACTPEESIFSGSAVLDRANSSGFGEPGRPAIVAVYTSALASGRQAQSLAYSTDGGYHWTKYEQNPVLDRGSTAFRDPKVFWYTADDGTGYWVMVAVEADDHRVVLYRSDTLREWHYLSDVGPLDSPDGLWECPDLFRLPIDGDPANPGWVLIVSRDPGRTGTGSYTAYLTGDFDGERFTPHPGVGLRRVDHGRDFYAGVTFDGAPGGRRVMLAWLSNWNYAEVTPTDPWRGAMSIPRELALVTGDGAPELTQRLPAEIEGSDSWASPVTVAPFLLEGRRPLALELPSIVDLELEPRGATAIGWEWTVGDTLVARVEYEPASSQLTLSRPDPSPGVHPTFASVERLTVPLTGGRLRLRLLLDHTSIELFADAGRVTWTDVVFPGAESGGAVVFARGGQALVAATVRRGERGDPIL
ncbi:sucrose-6-phosphate hydrolase SacC (GH32 family) [Galbitalea soli]|nr:sucrose-6-phosphate hydrolase SacC (GH32 family) [Galbitalea soli]